MSAMSAVPTIPELTKDFVKWRAEHKKHARLPDDLRQKAVLLAKSCDIEEVARAIKIGPHRLNGWVERFSTPSNDSSDRASALAPFIDVTASLIPPVPPQAAEPVSIDVMVQGRGSLKIAGALDAATIRFIVSTAFGSAP